MNIVTHTFWIQKHGNEENEYEDSFHTEKMKKCFRCAVADGATEATYSGMWAEMVVRYLCNIKFFKKGAFTPFSGIQFQKLQKEWFEKVFSKPLPWFAENKARQGAFATVLGIELHCSNHWRAVAVGDSCLFQVREDKVVIMFPIFASINFNNRPSLLSSNPNSEVVVQSIDGTWQTGDTFYLMTDALACWFIKEIEKGQKPWHSLQHFSDNSKFRNWVELLRDRNEIRNDDVTLMRICIE